jgi:hypothetical protein
MFLAPLNYVLIKLVQRYPLLRPYHPAADWIYGKRDHVDRSKWKNHDFGSSHALVDVVCPACRRFTRHGYRLSAVYSDTNIYCLKCHWKFLRRTPRAHQRLRQHRNTDPR